MNNLDNSLRNLDLCQKAINLAVSKIDEGIDEDNEIIFHTRLSFTAVFSIISVLNVNTVSQTLECLQM